MSEICPVCGEEFEKENGRQVYCSVDCRMAAKLEQRRKFFEKKRIKEKKKRTNGEIIDEYSREANRRHISYGKLQAERTIKMLREARE